MPQKIDWSKLPDQGGATAKAPQIDFSQLPDQQEEQGGAVSRFAGGVWDSLNPVEMAKGAYEAVRHPIQTAGNIYESHVGQAQKAFENMGQGRYSEAIGHGAAALLPIVGPAAANIGEELGKGEDIAGSLGKATGLIAGVATPKAITKPIAKTTEYAAGATLRPLLGPPKAIMRQTRAPLEIERTILKEGAVTQKSAGRKTAAAAGESTRVADEATKAGVTVPRSDVAQFPKTLDKVQNLTPNIKPMDELAALEADTIATLPPDITPNELLSRRRALDADVDTAYRAEERGGYVRSVADKGKKELSGNFRGTLRQAVPDIVASDDKARRLMLATKAWQDVNARPKGIPMSAALAGAGATTLGIPAAVPAAAVALGRTFPQIPAALMSPVVRAAGAGINPELLRAALIASLTGRDQQ